MDVAISSSNSLGPSSRACWASRAFTNIPLTDVAGVSPINRIAELSENGDRDGVALILDPLEQILIQKGRGRHHDRP